MGEGKPSSAVVWICGLPSSGKSTLARALLARASAGDFAGLQDAPVLVLDGDELRQPDGLLYDPSGYSFEPSARKRESAQIARAARTFARQVPSLVVVAAVTPFDESRRYAERVCPNCLVVWLSTSIEECERRDERGLWARARRGEVLNWPGLDLPYEPCEWAHVTLDTEKQGLTASADAVVKALERRW